MNNIMATVATKRSNNYHAVPLQSNQLKSAGRPRAQISHSHSVCDCVCLYVCLCVVELRGLHFGQVFSRRSLYERNQASFCCPSHPTSKNQPRPPSTFSIVLCCTLLSLLSLLLLVGFCLLYSSILRLLHLIVCVIKIVCLRI